jgi:hypothetical protein
LGLIGFWICFYSIYINFPYIRAGADLVTEFKVELVQKGSPFRSGHQRLRIMAFGDSKILAGFIPPLFDSILALGGVAAESYNLGLPGDQRFVSHLETLVSRGEAPDIALLGYPWPDVDESGPTVFRFISDDNVVLDRVFPFRHMPRDFFVTLGLASSRGGLPAFYRQAEQTLRRVELDRGYYFIVGQSHEKDDQLPEAFGLPTDTPMKICARQRVNTHTDTFRKLQNALLEHHVRCIFIPLYYRIHQQAEAPEVNAEVVTSLDGVAPFAVAGPDYYLYPNRLFSDPTHLNRRGAEVYTRQLAEAVVGGLREIER